MYKNHLEEGDAARVIAILERRTTIPGDGFSAEEINAAIDIAIREVGKSTPKPLVKKAWNPNRCPTCDADLGGDCDDGYYANPFFERCPNCGQLFQDE